MSLNLLLVTNNIYMTDKIFEIYPHNFNKDKLKIEFQDSDPQEFSNRSPRWRRSYKVGEYGNYLKDLYSKLTNSKVGVGYYHQLSGEKVEPHIDARCKCRINIKLSDDNTNVVIGNEKFKYDCALLNVSEYEHYVEQCEKDRIIFSILFVDKDFKTMKNIIK